jgi:hypothetical protein
MEIKKASEVNDRQSAPSAGAGVKKNSDTPAAPDAKKTAPQDSWQPAKRYTAAYDYKTAPGLNADIEKLNDELRGIESQSFQYQSEIDELKKEIEKDETADPSQVNGKIMEMNGLKEEIAEADAERTRKVLEIKQQYAEGKYKVSGSDIVDSLD